MNAIPPSQDVKTQILDTAQRIMGQKGFSAVGLNEILSAAGVPKGSFYHYFGSKEAFGVALLDRYFCDYLKALGTLLDDDSKPAAQRLMAYWQHWLDTQASGDPESKCLAVKLGAEVSDLSEAMRTVLDKGTSAIVARLAGSLAAGFADGSIPQGGDAQVLAASLYQLWLGASMLAKVSHSREPMLAALATTRRLLGQD
ncbi:TetR/AcrR family transcriptional regulator [Gallaecimonas kandeliae]|uniref:TetR/AcrR family transcriptional regulator n=1 Tax=Gallaecimonas kandeliae TaxID=3029055 RepID=UPI002647499A|nr:TetR/AcrR family transcriptional regulator [Gallaecimonas kandeliae]WKE64783.1 TetR/AcrR family transcriptional regulator [Gallaecimonas kandeliae]